MQIRISRESTPKNRELFFEIPIAATEPGRSQSAGKRINSRAYESVATIRVPGLRSGFRKSRQYFQQHPHNILSHDLVDVLLGNSFLEQRVGEQGPAAGVERRGDSAVEI
jgi:hypothetical protein